MVGSIICFLANWRNVRVSHYNALLVPIVEANILVESAISDAIK